ncbi:hypothetical protein IT399_00915 [Candidatus Nomurabacteria bacterium]|nr:hypothetical protein [Candidatus Nomurabacteria bacterium]
MSNDIKKIVKVSSLSIFFIFIIIYAFFISKDLIFGVKIRNVNIQDGTTISENVIKITGNAKNAVNLTLNGREISIDQAGNFNETISLLLGYNIVTIKAEDKFGYTDEKNYKLMH